MLSGYDPELPQKLKTVITRTFTPAFLVKLISSQLDADRLDYLLRDSLMTGTGYGQYDLDWLLNALRVGVVNGEQEVGVNAEKGRMVAESFVTARYFMYFQVYYHKATRAAEVVLEKAWQRAGDLVRNGYPISADPALKKALTREEPTVPEYLELDDWMLMAHVEKWAKADDPILADLARRLLERRLFKCIDLGPWLKDPEAYGDKYGKLREQMGNNNFSPDYYLAVDKAENSPYKDYYILQRGSKDGEADGREASLQIYLFDKNGQPEELSNASDLIGALRNEIYVNVRLYFPAEVGSLVTNIFSS